ncbi:MAG: zinc-dependent metalloprotease [Deltaproteobacteria bacterium]|nr:zinc-dependent metalloprotease [Deltaproteobacteria bacterium]
MRRTAWIMVAGAIAACDGSGLEGTVGAAAADTSVGGDTSAPPDPQGVVLAGELSLAPVTPVVVPDLPAGTTDGSAVIVARAALEGRFLYGVGADPDGVVGSLGGGAAGLAPLRVVIELAPDEAGGGTMIIRALDAAGAPVSGQDGVVEAYPYTDVDAATVRVDLAQAVTPLEVALSGSCGYAVASATPRGAPLYADGLLTWAADEVWARQGQCGWAPREARGLHVHYLRHAAAGRGFVPRAQDDEAPFGFFLAGSTDAPLIARLPGIAADEPPRTYVYHLSTSFPEAFVPAAEETFEAWNDALEEATGRRPFVVARAPADMIPWDPRFHVVHWDASSGAGAVAPFTEDPDTGEIFQSFVVMWFGELDQLVERYDGFFEDHPEVADALAPVAPTPAAALPARPLDLEASIARPNRPLDVPARALTPRVFVRRPLDIRSVRAECARRAALGVELSDDQIGHMIVVDFLLHEVGHNLGLRHNFIASVDRTRHEASHSASSTMDYVIGMLTPGSYDRDAMRHAYGAGAHARKGDYLYCTDETVELEPACIRWDWGHPIRWQLAVVDAYFEAYPASASKGDVDDLFDEGTLDDELTRLRRMVNSLYETWDEAVVPTFEELLGRVDCGQACVGHARLRSALALYLLYSRHRVTALWEPGYPDIWMDFPALNETQAAMVMATYFELVTSPDEPLALKTAIVGKLPTSAVSGAAELVQALAAHFAALPAPTGDDATVKAAVDAALAAL